MRGLADEGGDQLFSLHAEERAEGNGPKPQQKGTRLDIQEKILVAHGQGINEGCLWGSFFKKLLFLFFNVYLFLRERQSTSRGGAEREGDTESEAGSSL